MGVLRIEGLAQAPLDASAQFHSHWLPRIGETLVGRPGEDLALVFAPADYTHRAWCLAAVQELARAHAPCRINAVSGSSEAQVATALAYLDSAPGVTGQYLVLSDPA